MRGFTLLELTIVLVIGVLLLGIAVPLLGRQLPGAQFSAAVHAIATHARLARNLAITHNAPVGLIIDVNERAYRLSSESVDHRLPERLKLSFYAPESERIDAHSGAIRFYGDGSSTGGRITFTDGKRHSDVDIQWLTGRVSVRD
ncbi:MAG TPA: GspH/FimT family pseudopilin [Gammaproteobacteria bacterium]